jgi:hypothetical protein
MAVEFDACIGWSVADDEFALLQVLGQANALVGGEEWRRGRTHG